MSVTEIEVAISKLSSHELASLMAWLRDHHAKVWDGQIEADLESGRLDSILDQVDEEYDAGLAKPL